MPARKKAAKKPAKVAKKPARVINGDGTPPMDPKIKKLWVAALRSGKYRQGVGQLCQLDGDDEPAGYCCLGVLCDLSRKKWCYSAGALPKPVMKWAGLKDDDPVVNEEELSALNDDGNSFKRIATLIEKYL